MKAYAVATPHGPVSAEFDAAESPSGTLFVCAPGAGGHKSDKSMLALAAESNHRGIDVVRFNFVYRERGSGRPDAMPLLLETWRAVVAEVQRRHAPARLVLGGRSLGGRAASMLLAEGFAADALLLVAYPLHPPGQPDKLRTAHLGSIAVPVLCLNGTRDEFCTPGLMREELAKLGPNWTMHWLEAADHSLHVLKRSGRTDAEVLAEMGEATARWLAT